MASNQDDPARPGNEFFVRKDYENALKAYSTAIDKYPDMAKLYSNRALTYLKLERPFHALNDVEIGLKLEPDNDKLIYRKCKALLALRRFHEAGQFLHESIGRLEQLTKNKEFKAMIDDVTRLKLEYEHGQYDLPAMIEEANKSKFLDNHADYIAEDKFEIRNIDGKGRGLVAKKKIEAGELLIACKALVFGDAQSEGILSMDRIGRRPDVLSFAPMVEKMRKKLRDRPDLVEDFYRLYAGPKLGRLENWTEGESRLIDVDRIKWIIRMNHMGTDAVFDAITNHSTMGDEDGGLWLLPSYINHSCVDTNCTRYFVGDYIFIRATKLIEKYEEIVFSYAPSAESFEQRQHVCRGSFGFDCQCRLCALDRRDPIEIKRRMEEIRELMDDLKERPEQLGRIPYDIPTMKNLLQELLQLRPQRDLNYLAHRVQIELADLTSCVNAKESLRLLTEVFDIFKSSSEPLDALDISKMIYRSTGGKVQEKWQMESQRIAKLVYGDERMAEL